VNLIVVGSSLVVIVVALGVLSAMRIGVTRWVHFPVWLCIAMAAFFKMLTPAPAAWYEVTLMAFMAGLLWRHRRRLTWEVMNARTRSGWVDSSHIG